MSKSVAEIAASKARANRVRELHNSTKPDFENLKLENPRYEWELTSCLNWLTIEFSIQDLKELVLNWIINNKIDAPNLHKVADFKFSAIGKYVYILNSGGELNERIKGKLDDTVKALIKESVSLASKEEQKEKHKKFSANRGQVVADEIQDLVIQKKADDNTLSEAIFDSDMGHQDVLDFTNRVRAFLVDWESDDTQCVEMRDLVGEERVAYNKEKYHNAIKIAEMMLENIKAEKKVNRKKKTFAEQRAVRSTKNIKTKKVDMTYNIVSLPPEEIVGSKVLLTFNTKTRRLGYYVANDGGALFVKGTTIQNYDEEKSFAKIVRNTDRDLAPFRTAKNERRIEVLMTDNIKGVSHKLNGRLNTDTVILKAFKDK